MNPTIARPGEKFYSILRIYFDLLHKTLYNPAFTIMPDGLAQGRA